VVPLRVVPSGLDSRKAWQSSLTAGSSCRRQAAVVLRRATSHSSGLVASAAKKMRSASAARLCVTCNADDVTEAAQNGVTLAKDAFGDTITIYPSLESLPAVTYLDNNGFVTPALPERYAASVFAVLDDKKNVLYIGFSKDVRNTLRRLLARRTNLCCYYKLFNFEAVDPEGLMACRKQWFKELGATPVGNEDAAQRMLWEQPQKGEAISDTQMLAAAKDKCKQITKVLIAKGFKEPILFDQNLLQSGMCELMDTKGLDEKELARLREEERQLAARQVTVDAVDHRNREFTFSAEYEMIFQTNGGWMVDVNITKDDHTTAHRVIVSKHMVESVDARGPKELVEKAFAVLLGQKDMQRRTEGLISPLTFPINYFTVSEVEQYYPEAFQKMFDKKLPGGFWHFSRVVDYSTPAPISSEDQRLEPSS